MQKNAASARVYSQSSLEFVARLTYLVAMTSWTDDDLLARDTKYVELGPCMRNFAAEFAIDPFPPPCKAYFSPAS